MATPKRTTKDEPQPEYYTVKEAAAILRISISQLYVLLGTGEIESRKIGSRRIIPWYVVRATREG